MKKCFGNLIAVLGLMLFATAPAWSAGGGADAYKGFQQPVTTELRGRQVTLYLADEEGSALQLDFVGASKLIWRWTAGALSGGSGENAYEAFRMAPGAYYVAFLREDGVSVNIGLNSDSGRAVMVTGEIMGEGKTAHVGQKITEAALQPLAGQGAPVSLRTKKLAGKRLEYTYDKGLVYEHLYLTDSRVVVHGVGGLEAGYVDTETYQAFRIAEDVYMLGWAAHDMSYQYTVMVNLKARRAVVTGFGYAPQGGPMETPGPFHGTGGAVIVPILSVRQP